MKFLPAFLSDPGSPGAASLGLGFLRIAAGLQLFWAHGLPKLLHFHEKAAHFPDPLGFGSNFSLALVIFAECFCSVPVALGVLTRLFCLPILFNMAMAVRAHEWSVFGKGELAWIYGLAFLAIFLGGGGSLSLQSLFRKL
jgi:putative oxidoreductase